MSLIAIHRRVLATFLVCIGSLLNSAKAGDEILQPLSELQTAAEAFLVTNYAPHDGKVVAHANALDPRLRLVACAEPLDITLPAGRIGGTLANVLIRCARPVAWRVHVPITVHISQSVLIATRSLARLDPVVASDVRQEERDITTLSYGFITDLSQLENTHLLRPVAAGTVLTPGMLSPRRMISRGDQVTLVSTAGVIEVRAAGTALEDGGEGSHVKVRNLSSGRIIGAVVHAPGLVWALP